MSRRLTILAGIAIALAAALLFLRWDAAATQRCVDKGNSAEVCGWR